MFPTEGPDPQLRQIPVEDFQQSDLSQNKSKAPPEFWDKLSRVPLCRRALHEFNRRAAQPVIPRFRAEHHIKDTLDKHLKRFARRGGPDLCSIRGYPEQGVQNGMGPKRARPSQSSRPSSLSTITKSTTYSSKDAAFEQELIDNGIYPYNRSRKPVNWEEIQKRLVRPRPSLSPSQFSNGAFEAFQWKNEEATKEAEVMDKVFPIITGNNNIPSGLNQVFNNLELLGDHISNPQPDYFNGARPTEIRRKVRDDLEQYIIPSSQRHRLALPNFFTEVKGPDGKASEAKRQITQDLAAGARGMHKMQSYGLDEPIFDNKAHTFGSTYHNGYLQLYAMHPTQPGTTKERPEYHTTQIGAFALTGNLDNHRQGIGAYRNLQDLAKERRDEFIARANQRADNNEDESVITSADAYLTSFITTRKSTQSKPFTADSEQEESDSTTVGEHAMPAQPKRRTTARQIGRKKHKSRISDFFSDKDDK